MQKQSLPPHQKDGTGGTKTVTLAGIAGQQATCKTFIPGDKIAPHQAPTDVFVLVLDGQMDILVGGTPLGGTPLGEETSGMPPSRFAAGDYILIPANTTHTLVCLETARLLVFE